MTSITEFGAVGDGIADDTAALQEAARSGRRVTLPAGTWTHTDTLTFAPGTEFVGVGGQSATVLKAVGAFTTTQIEIRVEGCRVEGMTIDGSGGRGTGAYGVRIRTAGARRATVSNCRFIGQSTMAVLVRDGASRIRVQENWFEPNEYGPQIYFLTGVVDSVIHGNHAVDSAGFVISVHGACKWLTITGNSCDASYGELIGITYDCKYGTISHNHARDTGDNGISVTGSYWTVFGNRCEGNSGAGITFYGSNNVGIGNILHNNNRTTDSGGVRLHAAFGGLASNNIFADNVTVSEDGVEPVQFSAVRVDSLSYTAWAPGQEIGTSSTYRTYGENLYMAQGSGLTGDTPPTHTDGDVTDGNIVWRYAGTSDSGFLPARNTIGTHIDHGNRNPGVWPTVSTGLNTDLTDPHRLPTMTMGELPSPARGLQAVVSDAPGGVRFAQADGSVWATDDGQVIR